MFKFRLRYQQEKVARFSYSEFVKNWEAKGLNDLMAQLSEDYARFINDKTAQEELF